MQKLQDWPPGTRTENGTALCHWVQLYRYFVSQSSEFYRHIPSCCFSTSVYFCCLFRHRLSPETFGYSLVYVRKRPLYYRKQWHRISADNCFRMSSKSSCHISTDTDNLCAFIHTTLQFPYRRQICMWSDHDIGYCAHKESASMYSFSYACQTMDWFRH
jgi:hypothetical protein